MKGVDLQVRPIHHWLAERVKAHVLLCMLAYYVESGAMLKALDRQWLDLTTPLGKGILAFLSALAEDERARILARANDGRAAARKRGVKFGPKPKLAPHQEREAARMVCQDGQSLRVVARHYHVGHSTIVRALEWASSIA